MALKWDISEYTPRSLQAYSPAEVRREYTRQRDIAMKRLKRMEQRGQTGWFYDRNKERFPYTRDLTDAEIRQRLSELADFVESPMSTVRGWTATKNKTLNTLRQHGYEGINQGNLKDFGRFMEFYRASGYAKQYSSKRVAKMYSRVRSGKRSRSGSAVLLKAWDKWQKEQRT